MAPRHDASDGERVDGSRLVARRDVGRRVGVA